MTECKHERTFRGPDADRMYGTWQTWICVVCGNWHTTDHYRKDPGPWHPFSELAEATQRWEPD